MAELRRATTDYCGREDRVQLTGERGEHGDSYATVTLWMTQRLLNRAIPHLLRWLNMRGARNDVRAGPAGGASSPGASPASPPGPPAPESLQHAEWLVESLNISASERNVVLTFRSAAVDSTSLRLKPQALRHWLKILHRAYLLGEWRMDIWPAEWAAEAHEAPPAALRLLH